VLGLGVGDRLTVSVLGVEIEARIASLREIRWDSLGFNFALLFDPGSLAAAPYTWMATVTPPPGAEALVQKRLSATFPTSSVVRVKDVVGQVGDLLRQVGMAVRAAASVAIAAGLAVLVGAIAAQSRSRIRDSVIMKTLGATRRQLLASAALEYALIGGIVALVALLLGSLMGWVILTQIFDLGFSPDWGVVAATVLAGAAVTLGLGLLGAWRALGMPVAPALRSL
jgi:putative ABC transport system permease protein